ncbi:hypothetical protein C8R45DRAFT_1024822 [Mycena sanguinolenta]|nr:hypothetical protein C8R45DRAFT_1024822 [Mycena sanguinolenta]
MLFTHSFISIFSFSRRVAARIIPHASLQFRHPGLVSLSFTLTRLASDSSFRTTTSARKQDHTCIFRRLSSTSHTSRVFPKTTLTTLDLTQGHPTFTSNCFIAVNHPVPSASTPIQDEPPLSSARFAQCRVYLRADASHPCPCISTLNSRLGF